MDRVLKEEASGRSVQGVSECSKEVQWPKPSTPSLTRFKSHRQLGYLGPLGSVRVAAHEKRTFFEKGVGTGSRLRGSTEVSRLQNTRDTRLIDGRASQSAHCSL